MSLSLKCSLTLIITLSWCFGGGFDWGPYVTGIGGLLCLALATREAFQAQGLRRLVSPRAIPWVLWVALVAISIGNPTHEPQDLGLAREFVHSNATGKPDTVGFANPSVPVEHIEWLPTTSDAGRSALYLFSSVGIMSLAMALVLAPIRRRDIRCGLAILFFNSLTLALVGLFFHFADETVIFGRFESEGADPYASFHYKNVWVAFGVLSGAIGVGLAMRSWRAGYGLMAPKSPTAIFAFTTPFIFLSFPLVNSRAGLLLATLFLGWFVLVMTKICFSKPLRSNGRRTLAILCLVILGLGWFGWHISGAQLQKMIKKSEHEVEQVSANDPVARMIMAEDTWAMATARPWFGWGLATFSQIYPTFQNPRLYTKITFPGGEDFRWVPDYFEFAHCDWLQYLAETGWIGLILLVGTPLAWLIHGLRRGRSNILTHWLHVGGVLVLFIAVFEFPFGSEAVALLFAACLALGGKYALLEAKSRRRQRKRSAEQEKEGLEGVGPEAALAGG